jgi:hypothetical protein
MSFSIQNMHLYSIFVWFHANIGSQHRTKTHRDSLLLLMLMGWDYVSELQPPTCLLFIPQMTCEYGEQRWNYIDGKLKNSERNLSQCHFVHHKSHMDWPGCEPRDSLLSSLLKRTAEFLKLNRSQAKQVTGLLTGYWHLKGHLFKLGVT